MRKIDKIIIHCSATPKHKDFSAETIRDWHVKGNGWDDIGYHYVVRLDGSLEYGRPVQVPGAHCRGENKSSIGICYIGGMDEKMKEWEDTRTQEQKEKYLPLIACGELTTSVAVDESSHHNPYDTVLIAKKSSDEYILSGR